MMRRRPVEIPDKLFHVTKTEFVPSIMEQGLIPFKNSVGRFEEEDEEDNDRIGIFMTSNWRALLLLDESFNLRRDDFFLLEVDVTEFKDQLTPDIAYDYVDEGYFTEEELNEGMYDDFAWFINMVIPPTKITKLHKIKPTDVKPC